MDATAVKIRPSGSQYNATPILKPRKTYQNGVRLENELKKTLPSLMLDISIWTESLWKGLRKIQTI